MMTPLKNVTLRQLQIFMHAAEENSFAIAAQMMHLTQPAVSLQMKRLAEVLGMTLFEKDSRNIKLTSAGQALLKHARKINQYIAEADNELYAIKEAKVGIVKIGMVTTTQYFGPKLIEAFSNSHPEIELDISIANRKHIVAKLERNEIDLAIMGRTPSRLEVSADEFFQHPYVVIAPHNHPLTKSKRIKPEELLNKSFLAREEGSGTRMIMDNFFMKNSLEVPHFSQFASNESIKQAVIANMGLAFISAHTVELELRSDILSILNVNGMPAIRSWLILNPSGKYLSPAAQAFKHFVTTEGPAYMKQIFS